MTLRAEKEIRRTAERAIVIANHERNRAKGSWHGMSRRRLFWLFLVEVWELTHALWTLYQARRVYDSIPCYETVPRFDQRAVVEAAQQHVKHEIGDCVAFLAFLEDRL